MPSSLRGALIITAAACALVSLSGCGKGDSKATGAANTSSAPAETTPPTSANSAAAQPTRSGGADVQLHVTGAATLDVKGHAAAAFCAYYVPSTRSGVSILATSKDFPGTGDWSLTLQGDSPTSAGLLLAIGAAQYSGNNGDDPAKQDQGGKITVSDDVQHAKFAMHLVNIINHDQKIAVTGSIDCGGPAR